MCTDKKKLLFKSSLSLMTVLSGIYGSQAMEDNDKHSDFSQKSKTTLVLKAPQTNSNNQTEVKTEKRKATKILNVSQKKTRFDTGIEVEEGLNNDNKLPSSYSCLEDVPEEIFRLIFHYLGSSKHNCELVCRTWHKIQNQDQDKDYDELNKKHKYLSFNGSSGPLSERMKNKSNEKLKTIMWTHRNMRHGSNDDISREQFEQLCMEFKKMPFLSEESDLKQFIELLSNHYKSISQAIDQQPNQNEYKNKMLDIQNILAPKLRLLCTNDNIDIFQNEIILYYHISRFVLPQNSFSKMFFKNDAFFPKLTSSLADVIRNHDELVEQRQVHFKTHFHWKRIIELDFKATTNDLRNAALTHFSASLFMEADQYMNRLINSPDHILSPEDAVLTQNIKEKLGQ